MTEHFDPGVSGAERLLTDARRALDVMRAGGDAADRAADPAVDRVAEVRGEGSAADGQVQAVAVTGGRLESVRVDPRAMRMGSEALSEQVVLAVNAALDDLRGKVSEQPMPGAVDPAALAAQMRELQDESVRQMEKFGQAIGDALGRITRSTGREG